jgi:hypothetical protein
VNGVHFADLSRGWRPKTQTSRSGASASPGQYHMQMKVNPVVREKGYEECGHRGAIASSQTSIP